VHVRHHEHVVGVVAAEVVPVLVIPAAEDELVMRAAAVVDGGQVVADGAQVRELHVALADALAAASQRLQPTFHRYTTTTHTRLPVTQRPFTLCSRLYNRLDETFWILMTISLY